MNLSFCFQKSLDSIDDEVNSEELVPGPMDDMSFEDFDVGETLGVGTFGRVKIVKHFHSGEGAE